jgi:hypothetical protein
MKRQRASCSNVGAWLRANGHDTSPLTGQDSRALLAIAHCWELLAVSDGDGRAAAMGAVRHLLNGMQRKCWPLARELIAKSLDWGDRERIWRELDVEDLHAAGEP